MNLGIIHIYPDESMVNELSKDNNIYLFLPMDVFSTYKSLEVKYDNLTLIGLENFGSKECTNKVFEYAVSRSIDVFLPLYEGGLVMSSIVSGKMNLPFYSLSSVLSTRNKYLLSELLSYSETSCPETIPVYNDTKYRGCKELLGESFILKISDSMNSQGVVKIRSQEDFEKYKEILFSYIQRDKGVSNDRNVFSYGKTKTKLIAQKLCEGREFNVDVLICDGGIIELGIFEKANSTGPFYPESSSHYPATLKESELKEIEKGIKDCISALDLRFGVAHLEFRYEDSNNKSLKVLDVGLRPGGAYTVKAVGDIFGIKYRRIITEIMLSKGKTFPSLSKQQLAILYGGIIYHDDGVVEDISGVEDVMMMDNVKDFRQLNEIGDFVKAPPLSAQPHFCYYYLVSDTAESLLKSHEYVQNKIKIRIGGINHD